MATRTPRLLLTTLRTLAGLTAAFTLLLQTGCSSVFFYPDQVTYITPDRLNLEFEDVFVETPDGETLHGWWLPASSEPKGTVYFLHGNAQNISSHIMNVAWLPEKRYNVFLIDYRGYGRSTGAPDIEGTLHDAETGLRWLVDQPDVQNQPLFLLGQSLGGALGTALASEWVKRDEHPPLDGVILDGTFSGFRAIAREKLGDFWLTWPLQVPLSWTITDEYEAYERIGDISPVPVMVIHSVRDGIIPFHHGKRLYEAAEEPKTFLQTDTPHASTFVIPGYQDEVLEFMEGE
ncbi:alpha/beta hydrolase [Marinobacter salarius]|uniref:alpha/beta hydrolase n=1 Tax=Marinobacter salarius TaxID=1420917 RepID=UPI0010AAFD49|nr:MULTISPECIES: alpha/beta hydrolase [Marinobacter]MBJ7300516.1 alpha/beta hydrolase [Marinobacter salarius]HIO31526.1 alpha/beta hydrolase [Marinobacter salarius]HIO99333.1 alpha/beta hydrolase [Marinobacter salarius]